MTHKALIVQAPKIAPSLRHLSLGTADAGFLHLLPDFRSLQVLVLPRLIGVDLLEKLGGIIDAPPRLHSLVLRVSSGPGYSHAALYSWAYKILRPLLELPVMSNLSSLYLPNIWLKLVGEDIWHVILKGRPVKIVTGARVDKQWTSM